MEYPVRVTVNAENVTREAVAAVFGETYPAEARVERSEYRDPRSGETVTTETVVASAVLPSGAVPAAYAALASLADLSGEDCFAVAVTDPVNGRLLEGKLVGPRAEKWGEFNIDFFKF